ncbi:MAG: ABC transporter permease [Dongiaceae bacterium]
MKAFATYAAGRLASAALTLLGISLLIFVAMRSLEGNFEDIMTPQGPPQLREQIRARFGFDQPLPVQYLKWVSAALQGDFGVSLVTQAPIWPQFAERLSVSAEIALLTTLLALTLGLPLGLASGLARGSAGKVASRLAGALLMSVPDFVVASVLIYVFSKYALGLTIGRWVELGSDPVGHLRAVVLPCLALAPLGTGLIMATCRHAVLSILAESHVAAAVARGKSRGQIVRQHVLRNAAIPVVTVLAIYCGFLLGGTVLVELIFSLPGFGRFLLQGVLNRDYPVVQAGVLIVAAFFVALNMAADLLYGWLDPRVAAGVRR